MKNLFCLHGLNSAAAEKAALHREAKALCPDPAEGQRTLAPHAEGLGPERAPGQVLRHPHHDTIINYCSTSPPRWSPPNNHLTSKTCFSRVFVTERFKQRSRRRTD